MYKILLVDDEPLFTEYLSRLIDWESCGCTLCGMAADGEQAVEMLVRFQPDLLFLDINIPIFNGLEVCRQLRELAIPCEVVIVSAHSDFQFAQKAIKYDVADYLLKPFDQEEFRHTLGNCLKNVREKRSAALKKCLSGQGTLPGTNAVVLLRKKAGQAELAALGTEIDTDFRRAGGSCWHCVDGGQLTFACSVENNAEELRGFFTGYAHDGVSIAIGDVADGLSQSFRHAQMALENRVLAPNNIICYETLEHKPGGAVFSQNEMTRLIGCLENHDEAGVSALIGRLFGLVGEKGISFQYFMSVFSSLVLYMAQHYGKSRGDAERLLSQQSGVLKELEDASDIAGMAAVIENYVYELYSDCIQIAPPTRRGELVEKINRYIANNYAQKGFTAEKMAAELLYENSYMRRVYKTETGTTILKALEDYRINKAKELLKKRSYRHSEIAEMTGFGDQYYFSKRFKQIVGCTPSEFEVMTTNG